MKGERTLSGLYHILTGKRSSQTLQDARVYQISRYFGIYKSLSRYDLDRLIDELEQEGDIERAEGGSAYLTTKGEAKVEDGRDPLPYLNGFLLHDIVPQFARKLLLYIQTITNMTRNELHFIPIIEDKNVQEWVRERYDQDKKQLQAVNDAIFCELHAFLTRLTETQAHLFVNRLSGGGYIGKTLQQLSDDIEYGRHDIHVFLHHLWSQLYVTVRNETAILYSFTDDTKPLITRSAQKTHDLLQKGHQLAAVQEIRNLKMSTIQDHIVEMALMLPEFDILMYIPDSDAIHSIAAAAKRLETKKLKTIHQACDGRFDYFHIRLVLARYLQ